jgi:uncharacterized membrane protein
LLNVTLFSREDCHLCKIALDDLEILQEKYPHKLFIVDIDQSPELQVAFGNEIPVIEVGPYTLKAPFDVKKIEMTLGAAFDRQKQLEKEDQSFEKKKKKSSKINRGDQFSKWFSNHYMVIFNLIILIYVGLPFLAPVLLKIGVEPPAAVIYKIYSGLCHQLSFRSWFLFGEQPIYPRELAGIEGYLTFHQATGLDEIGLSDARNFVGTPEIGYKIALCQRDVAIYLAILLFGILFVILKKKIKPLPVWAWIIFGLAPIGFDGGSQIFSQLIADPIFSFIQPYFKFIPLRESTPLLRTLTGFLFGFTTAWFGYPYVEEAMVENRKVLAAKFARLNNSTPKR